MNGPWVALPARDRRAVSLGVVLMLLLLGGGRVVPQLRAGWDRAVARAALSSSAGRRADALSGDVERIVTLTASARRALGEMDGGVVPAATPSQAAASLAAMLDQAGTRAGVRVSSTSIRADSAWSGRYARIAVRAFAATDVTGLLRWLEWVERGALHLSTAELSVTQPAPSAGDRTPESLRVELLVEGLARRGTSIGLDTVPR